LSGHECSKKLPITKHSSGRKIWVPIDSKKASTGPEVSTKDIIVHFGQRFGLFMKIAALVILWVVKMNSKNY
jgi:hypothetical protein